MRPTLLLVAALASACASAPPPETRTASTSKGESRAGLLAAFRAFDFTACEKGGCAQALATAAGDRLDKGPSPRAILDTNPDPEWLVEWDKLPTSAAQKKYVYEAMALARVNRTWKTRCEEGYAKYDRDLTERLQATDAAILKANTDPNPYDRLAALLALRPKGVKAAPDAFAASADPVRFRVEEAIFEAFEATNRTFVYLVMGYGPSADLLGAMHAREPKEAERDLFCHRAASTGLGDIPPLPRTSPELDDVRGVVAPLFIESRARWLAGRPKDMADVTRARFGKATLPNPQLPPGVRGMTLTKVKEFLRDGKEASLVVTLFSERRDSSGKTIKVDETIRAKFADWPSGLTLAEGDILSFWGTEDQMKETVLKSTPELEHQSRTTTVTGKHVFEVEQKGKKLNYF